MLIIYTREACSKCDQAKDILNNFKIEYEEKNIDFGTNRAMIHDLYPQLKELPVVLNDDVLIGGLGELNEHIEKGNS